MKKDLPDHSLRDQLDALPFEFEEAHWDNLGSRLHANGVEADKKNQRTVLHLSSLGLLLLGLLLGGMAIYFGKSEVANSPETPVVPQEYKAEANSPTAINESIQLEKSEKETVQNSTAAPKEELPQKAQQRQETDHQQAVAKTTSITDLSEDQKGVEENRMPLVVNKVSDEQILSTTKHKVEVLDREQAEAAPKAQTRSVTSIKPYAPISTTIQPVSLTDRLFYSEISKLKLITKKQRKNRWGITSGFNFSNGKPGLFLGLSYQRTIKSPWYLEAGIVYRGSNVKPWDIDPSNVRERTNRPDFTNITEIHRLNTLRYVDFPLLLRWKPIPQWSIQAGPKLALLTLASGRVSQTVITDASVIPPEMETRTTNNTLFLVNRIKSLRMVEWGAVIGATWHLDDHLGIGLRSHFGLTPFSDPNIIGPSPQKRNLDIQFLVQLYL